jgi:hypothetical protein
MDELMFRIRLEQGMRHVVNRRELACDWHDTSCRNVTAWGSCKSQLRVFAAGAFIVGLAGLG